MPFAALPCEVLGLIIMFGTEKVRSGSASQPNNGTKSMAWPVGVSIRPIVRWCHFGRAVDCRTADRQRRVRHFGLATLHALIKRQKSL